MEVPGGLTLAHELRAEAVDPVQVARACFEWVRDEIGHSGDSATGVTTCRASDVLKERTGWRFAKSYLLAALLRANDLPAGLCCQRLQRDAGNGYTLDGLNAVYLPYYRGRT